MSTDQRLVRARLASDAIEGCERILIRELKGREAISELFAFELDVVIPEDVTFTPAAVLGKDVSIVFSLADEDVRTVHGMVCEMLDGADVILGHTHHQLRIVPRLYRLALSHACEVFLKMSVVDIALDKLKRVRLTGQDVRVQLSSPPKPTEFRLQYDETDLAFVSRHLERAGIAYSFDHSGSKDTLVLSDANTAFPATTGPELIPYIGRDRGDQLGVTSFRARSAMLPQRYTVNDYFEQHPKLDLKADFALDVPFDGNWVEFGAGQITPGEAKDIARLRAQSRQAVAEGFDATSTSPYVESGRTVAVDGKADSNKLLVVWVQHHLKQNVLTHAGDEDVGYDNTFRAVLASRHYRPALTTPWPHISGFVEAVTDQPPAGMPGDTAVLDEQGRYTIRFYFDTADGSKRQVSSTRVRMMQPHVGPGYGSHFPLKPGIEVFIAFIEGDPDRPVIAGAVHNGLDPHVVTSRNPKIHHVQTLSGVQFSMKDS
jgi:type VI secretion system secreted protein VgrG